MTINPRYNDCETGDYGFWDAKASPRIFDLSGCAARCEACARCSTVSFSRTNADCSWYASCDLRDLRRPPKDAADYLTMRVKHSTPVHPPPPKAGIPRVAIATLATGARVQCALVQWCERVGVFRRALRQLGWLTTVVVISDVPRHRPLVSCPGVEWRVPDASVATAQARCAAQHGKHSPQAATAPAMLKWAVIGMVEFEYVLFIDADVDLMPDEVAVPSAAAAQARVCMPAQRTPALHGCHVGLWQSQSSTVLASPYI